MVKAFDLSFFALIDRKTTDGSVALVTRKHPAPQLCASANERFYWGFESSPEKSTAWENSSIVTNNAFPPQTGWAWKKERQEEGCPTLIHSNYVCTYVKTGFMPWISLHIPSNSHCKHGPTPTTTAEKSTTNTVDPAVSVPPKMYVQKAMR